MRLLARRFWSSFFCGREELLFDLFNTKDLLHAQEQYNTQEKEKMQSLKIAF